MFDIAIVGAGPAGASAAIFAAKAGKKTILIDNEKNLHWESFAEKLSRHQGDHRI